MDIKSDKNHNFISQPIKMISAHKIPKQDFSHFLKKVLLSQC